MNLLLSYYLEHGMEAMIFMQYLPGGLYKQAVLAAAPLLFNPVKLVLVIVWVYLCMYLVQRVQFSPLVTKRFKSLANVATLLAGPVLLFILWTIDLIKKYRLGRYTFLELVTGEVGKVFSGIKTFGYHGSRGRASIILLDSSGRSMAEVYGQGRGKQVKETTGRTEQIIAEAISQRSSDILIDPREESSYSVRFRIDGMLRIIDQIDADKCNAIVNSIKAVSGMDISEKRRPQDGAFVARMPEGTVSFRVASAGVLYGEKLSIRVLNPVTGLFSLKDLNLSTKHNDLLESYLIRPSGMILICGPTGSGKTTTLYAMLNEIDPFSRNIITVEDPIEYVIPNVSQIEVNPRADITFAKALRSILRQDPDVICVGEIRDEETAAIALQASQTGHLVLATIHSNSNISALIRLLDLGIKPLLLSSALSVIVSQRLVRKLCLHCKRPVELTDEQIEKFGKSRINPEKIFTTNGCRHCGDTGYQGRAAVFDTMAMDNNVRQSILSDKLSMEELKKWGSQKGKSTLRKEGMKKVIAGITTIAEVRRVTSDIGV